MVTCLYGGCLKSYASYPVAASLTAGSHAARRPSPVNICSCSGPALVLRSALRWKQLHDITDFTTGNVVGGLHLYLEPQRAQSCQGGAHLEEESRPASAVGVHLNVWFYLMLWLWPLRHTKTCGISSSTCPAKDLHAIFQILN